MEDRIRRLEEQVRRQRRSGRVAWLALAAIVAAWLGGRAWRVAAADESGSVVTRRLILKDSKGRVRGSFGVGDGDDGVGLELFGQHAERLASLHVSDSGAASSPPSLLLFYEHDPKKYEGRPMHR